MVGCSGCGIRGVRRKCMSVGGGVGVKPGQDDFTKMILYHLV